MRKLISYVAFICATFLMISCGGKTKTETSTENTDETVTEAPATPAVDPATLPVKEVTIQAVGNSMAEMKYDVVEIEVAASQKVKINLENKGTDAAMQHNIVFVLAGTSQTVATDGLKAGPDKQYVPESSNVIAASKMLGPGENTVLEFEAPAAPGKYEYVCTYPGHNMMMKGVLVVK